MNTNKTENLNKGGLIASVSIVWLWYHTMVLPDVTIGKMIKNTCDSEV